MLNEGHGEGETRSSSELESAYDQIIGQIVKMIDEAHKWIIRTK